MITTTEKARRVRLPWFAVALLCIAFGTGAFVRGILWTGLEIGGWPWDAEITYGDGGAASTILITHPGGRTETFKVAGSEAAVTAADERLTERLKDQYNIPERITAGRVLEPVGLGLVAVGGGILVWRATRIVGRRDSRSQPSTS